MRVVGFLLLGFWAAAGLAQTTMYKCTDAQRRITYSSDPCEKLGLKDAGPIPDRVTSMPSTEPPKPATRKDSAKEPALRPKGDADAGRGGTQITPIVPLLEKLTK